MNMKGSIKVLATFAFLAMALTLGVTPAAAQLNSNIQPITINANLPEALTVNIAAGGNTITIPLAPNTAANQSTLPAGGTIITTAWVLGPTRTAVKLFVYSLVANPLSNGTDTIPATKISISNTGQAGAYSPLVTGGGAFGNAGLQIGGTTNITNANRASSRNDTIFFQIDTTFNPQLSAGLYSGTVNVEAQATP
jgi:hypothetical protein